MASAATLPTRYIKEAGEYNHGERQRISRKSEGNLEKWSRQILTLTCGHYVTLVDKPRHYPQSRDNQQLVACAICYSEGKYP